MRPSLVLACAAQTLAAPLKAQTATDSAAVIAVVAAFHAALSRGDSAAALALLADDVVVLESGGMETRDQYRNHHLPADIRFAQAVPSTRTVARVTVAGAVAWVAGTSEATGAVQDRPINSSGAELMVLSRDASGWRIRAIHWSSRERRSTR